MVSSEIYDTPSFPHLRETFNFQVANGNRSALFTLVTFPSHHPIGETLSSAVDFYGSGAGHVDTAPNQPETFWEANFGEREPPHLTPLWPWWLSG